MSRFSALFLTVSLGLPGVALAKDAALCPLVPKNADAQQVVNVSQLIWSELEFMPEYDSVALIERAPGALNLSCLNSASCLRGVASEVGGDDLVVGSLNTTSSTFELDLVLFDAKKGSITRRQTFTLGASPEQVADGMNAVMKELITGVGAKAAAAEEPAMADFSMDDDISFDDGGFGDDDFGDFDISDDDPGEADRRAEEEAARRKEEEAARRRAEEEERRRREAEAEERRRKEEAARRRAEEEERRRREAEEERRRQEEADRRRREEEERRRQEEASSQQDDELDLSMISFGSAADKVTEEEIADEISFASPGEVRREDDRSSSSRSRSSSSYYEEEDDFLAEEEEDFSIADLEDMDEEPRSRREKPEREKPEKTERTRSSSSSRGSKASVERESPDRRMFTTSLRVGYSLYGGLNFLTYGVELGIPVHDVVYVMAGVEGYSVERQVPPKFQVDGKATEWNHIAPINLGAMYKNRNRSFQPYVGADVIFANYYVDSATGAGAWTVGGRLRGGFDFMLATNIGLNLNASLGYWGGDKWTLIDQNTQNGGILPQISAGTVIAF